MGHDTGVAIFEDKSLLYAIETERITRRKHDSRVDAAIDQMLEDTGLALTDFDLVAASTNVRQSVLNLSDPDAARQRIGGGELTSEQTCRIRGVELPCLVVAHEASHAILACHFARYRSPLLVLVNEGRGSFSRNSLFRFDDNELKLVEYDQLPWFANGFGWSALGFILGYGRGPNVAGTLMALAAFGEVDETFRALILESDEGLHYNERDYQRKAAEPIIKYTESRFSHFDGHARAIATLQDLFSRRVADYLATSQRRQGISSLGLSGGCALNIPTNSLVRRTLDEGVCIPPPCNDSGQALGAAVFALLANGIRPDPFGVYNNGVPESRTEVLSSAAAHDLKVRDFDPDLIATKLCSGEICAIFQGAGELGPRALGNRSILANPILDGMRRQVSEDLKGRHWFRPLSPCMSLETFHETIDSDSDSPYMLFQYDASSLRLPEATHVDNTARVQTVDRSDNPRLYSILRRFEAASGLHGLINTSLNRKGMPISHFSKDVITDFRKTCLDTIIVDDLVVELTLSQ